MADGGEASEIFLPDVTRCGSVGKLKFPNHYPIQIEVLFLPSQVEISESLP